ncbi:MAG: hypothetical protein GY715_07720 [Planctomycetes bacterium]|nr:hypothetical protein [Planctomycetota bacterium]
MNRKHSLFLGLSLGAATLALAGCTASQPSGHAGLSFDSEPVVALGDLGVPADSSGKGWMYFGAGDALGQEIFTQYVASLRASESIYATGGSDFPRDE